MRLVALLLTALLGAAPAAAQPVSPAAQSPPAPAAPAPGPAPAASQVASTRSPVSLDRIREALRRTPERPVLGQLDRSPDFTVQVEEHAHLDAILSKLDFSSGPAPPGGLYAYEQHRRLFDPVTQPLMQPYAAFNGGQLITVALQNLIVKFLGGRVLDAVSAAERQRLDTRARDEVDQAIAAYCAAHPNRASIQLCTGEAAR